MVSAIGTDPVPSNDGTANDKVMQPRMKGKKIKMSYLLAVLFVPLILMNSYLIFKIYRLEKFKLENPDCEKTKRNLYIYNLASRGSIIVYSIIYLALVII
jgi:hypothetical protein